VVRNFHVVDSLSLSPSDFDHVSYKTPVDRGCPTVVATR
jgi:hypothetical protein